MKADREALALAAGKRLRHLRENAGLTWETIATLLVEEKRAYGNWEQGKRLVPPPVALKIAVQFGVTLDWIYAGSTSGLTGARIAELNLPSGAARA